MIIFYSKKGCPWCDDARMYLEKNNLEFEEREVRDNRVFFDEMVEHSGQTKAPTFIIDDVVLADASAEELNTYLASK